MRHPYHRRRRRGDRIVAFPCWAIFDHLVDPAHGTEFATLRFALELPLIVLLLSLFTGPGRRHPEIVMLLMMGFIQAAIGYMTTYVVDAYAPYALGMSLAVYASSFLLIWPWQYTAALIGLTWRPSSSASPPRRRRSTPPRWRPWSSTSAPPR